MHRHRRERAAASPSVRAGRSAGRRAAPTSRPIGPAEVKASVQCIGAKTSPRRCAGADRPAARTRHRRGSMRARSPVTQARAARRRPGGSEQRLRRVRHQARAPGRCASSCATGRACGRCSAAAASRAIGCGRGPRASARRRARPSWSGSRRREKPAAVVRRARRQRPAHRVQRVVAGVVQSRQRADVEDAAARQFSKPDSAACSRKIVGRAAPGESVGPAHAAGRPRRASTNPAAPRPAAARKGRWREMRRSELVTVPSFSPQPAAGSTTSAKRVVSVGQQSETTTKGQAASASRTRVSARHAGGRVGAERSRAP